MRKWMTADVPGSAEGASHEGTWQTQIDLHDRPCRVHPRCGRLSLPGAPSLLGRDQPYSPSPPPRLSPPTSTHPSVRLHRTMSLCGTLRVCVPECPPLGRPSIIKWVLVKMIDSARRCPRRTAARAWATRSTPVASALTARGRCATCHADTEVSASCARSSLSCKLCHVAPIASIVAARSRG